MSEQQPTQLDRYIGWFKNNRVFSIVLLLVAITIGLASVTGAISTITAFVGSVFRTDSFDERLEQAQNAYASQDFELAKEIFDDLSTKAENDSRHKSEFEKLRNASLASGLMVAALEKERAFRIEQAFDERAKLEKESADLWDRANRKYPYGVKHD